MVSNWNIGTLHGSHSWVEIFHQPERLNRVPVEESNIWNIPLLFLYVCLDFPCNMEFLVTNATGSNAHPCSHPLSNSYTYMHLDYEIYKNEPRPTPQLDTNLCSELETEEFFVACFNETAWKNIHQAKNKTVWELSQVAAAANFPPRRRSEFWDW